MAKIVIDGYIARWGFSKQYIRHLLAETTGDIEVHISSLGGDVDHAIDICNQLQEREATATLSGMVASSATLVALGCKRVKMFSNSFYLIHKPMNWVDEWGSMNEDEIKALIAKLEETKRNLATVTLTIASMYVAKTGKTLEEIIALMKNERWLNAQEAQEFGFIDEILEPETNQATTNLQSAEFRAMLTTQGLPALPSNSTSSSDRTSGPAKGFDDFCKKLMSRFPSVFKNEKPPKPQNDMVKDKLIALYGLNASATEDEVVAHITAEKEAKEQADADLATANTTIAERDATIAALGEETSTDSAATTPKPGAGNDTEKGFAEIYSDLKEEFNL